MKYYVKKNWKMIALTTSFGLLCEGMYVILQLIMMQSFGAAIQMDFRKFLLWTSVGVGGCMI